MQKKVRYTDNLLSYQRLKTREVSIGKVSLGGNHPIRIQSMTTTDTMDTMGTVEQTVRLAKAGCEYVRITAPHKNAAENLQNIKDALSKRGCHVPLIADIHFTPKAAEIAAQIVEKVRVNPGNYADRKHFQTHAYTSATYAEEIERIRDRFSPLVKLCKKHATAMRIGCNHGSLSDRILSHYGDTPLGMVEAALEFVRICQELDYHDLVLSMKASNPIVMVQAYRLLVERMKADGHVYPLHLGVTEAGEGEDGRIKSAMGIGTLLGDGIGDTVRVSLTEDPEFEAPVAREIIRMVSHIKEETPRDDAHLWPHVHPYEIRKRQTRTVDDIGGENVPRVIMDYSKTELLADLVEVGFEKIMPEDKWRRKDVSSDYIYLGKKSWPADFPQALKGIVDYACWQGDGEGGPSRYPYFASLNEWKNRKTQSKKANFICLELEEINASLKESFDNEPVVLILYEASENASFRWREAVLSLEQRKIDYPLILGFDTDDTPNADVEKKAAYQIRSSCKLGSLLIDGKVSGLWLKNPHREKLKAIFGLYQSVRLRISKTEYISCPSCGRTLFDLQEVSAKIRKKTEHLKGVKIGIMGCIVNGPGEMADADFGYVGTGPGKISLYKGQKVVVRNIDEAIAVDRLVELLKEHKAWVEPAAQKLSL